MNDITYIQPRPKRRRRKRYVINAWRLTLSCLLFLLFLELVATAFTSPWFYITNIKVEGTKILSPKAVVQYLNIPPKTNLFRLQTRRLVKRLQCNPVVFRASVHKVVPGTLVVRITERKPILTLSANDKYYEIDRYSVPFRIVPKPSANLPLVICPAPRKILLGKPLKTQNFNSAIECLLLAQQKKNFTVAKIFVDQNGDLCLNTSDGLEVKMGRPNKLDEKLDIVESAMEQLPSARTGAEYIDVSCGREGSAIKYK
ncbi:MAG: FtsQ-type POTRA domain-containing protein [Armatimonadota bacterium]|nr:FtsQ-type POTRA domain-containing protein [Armatimonadota bacterium]